jgi:hypothetical protein
MVFMRFMVKNLEAERWRSMSVGTGNESLPSLSAQQVPLDYDQPGKAHEQRHNIAAER